MTGGCLRSYGWGETGYRRNTVKPKLRYGIYVWRSEYCAGIRLLRRSLRVFSYNGYVEDTYDSGRCSSATECWSPLRLQHPYKTDRYVLAERHASGFVAGETAASAKLGRLRPRLGNMEFGAFPVRRRRRCASPGLSAPRLRDMLGVSVPSENLIHLCWPLLLTPTLLLLPHRPSLRPRPERISPFVFSSLGLSASNGVRCRQFLLARRACIFVYYPT